MSAAGTLLHGTVAVSVAGAQNQDKVLCCDCKAKRGIQCTFEWFRQTRDVMKTDHSTYESVML